MTWLEGITTILVEIHLHFDFSIGIHDLIRRDYDYIFIIEFSSFFVHIGIHDLIRRDYDTVPLTGDKLPPLGLEFMTWLEGITTFKVLSSTLKIIPIGIHDLIRRDYDL